ncbi:unnamed protein product [Pedinophyceae sp. YPF-701]|nr:unnamed protein product [Pedinophyceae sp. YPF-701]
MAVSLAGVGAAVVLQPALTSPVARVAALGLGAGYTSYKIFQVLSQRNRRAQEADRWLKLMATLAVARAGEEVLAPILDKFPWWQHARLGLLAWLVLAKDSGAGWVWDRCLHPFFARHRHRLEVLEEHVTAGAQNAAQEHEESLGYVRTQILHIREACAGMWERLEAEAGRRRATSES